MIVAAVQPVADSIDPVFAIIVAAILWAIVVLTGGH